MHQLHLEKHPFYSDIYQFFNINFNSFVVFIISQIPATSTASLCNLPQMMYKIKMIWLIFSASTQALYSIHGAHLGTQTGSTVHMHSHVWFKSTHPAHLSNVQALRDFIPSMEIEGQLEDMRTASHPYTVNLQWVYKVNQLNVNKFK